MTDGEPTGEGILTFTDQKMTCEECDADVKTDTIFDRDTSHTYFFCPICEMGNRR